MNIHQLGAKTFHSHSIGQDNAVTSTSNEEVVLLAPSDASNLACVTRESHSGRILTGIELKHVNRCARYCCEIVATVGEFYFRTIFEGVDVFITVKGFPVLLHVCHT